MKPLSHTEQIAAVIARHEFHLSQEQAKMTQRQAEIAAAAEAEAAKLEPARASLAELNHRLYNLANKHDALTWKIKHGAAQLAQQQQLCENLDTWVRQVFDSGANEQTPNLHTVWQGLEIHPELRTCKMFVPMFQALLEQAREALAAVEQDLADLAKSSKLPAA
jgi:hypothetical protein